MRRLFPAMESETEIKSALRPSTQYGFDDDIKHFTSGSTGADPPSVSVVVVPVGIARVKHQSNHWYDHGCRHQQ